MTPGVVLISKVIKYGGIGDAQFGENNFLVDVVNKFTTDNISADILEDIFS